MPNIAIQLTPGSLPPNPCFTSEQARFNAYVAAIQSSLPVNFTTVIVSMTAPAPDDRDKVWIKIDGAGRILGTFLFSNGLWQTIFPTNPWIVPGEFREYDPALYTPAQSADEPWFPCNGSVTGVQDRRGLFLVGAGTRVLTAAQIAAGVQATTFVAGTNGGSETTTMIAANIAAHQHLLAGFLGASTPSGSRTLNPSLATPETPTPGYISGGNTTGLAADGVTPNPPTAMQTLPPYEPVYWMQWRPDLV